MRFFFLLLFFSSFIQAQQFSSIIKSEKDSLALDYVNVSILNKRVGTNTDANGNFVFNMKNHELDTLLISHLGFKSRKIAISKIINNPNKFSTIYLLDNNQQLEEVIINSTLKKYGRKHKLGVRKKWFHSPVAVQFGMEQGLLIRNEKEKFGKVEELSFWIAEDEELFYNKRLTWFRIKFYSYDKKNNEPGDLLTYREIIVKPRNETKKLNVDLSKYNIPFPKNGICVVLETVNPKPDEQNDSRFITYPRLIFSNDKENKAWSSYRDHGWFQMSDEHMFRQTIAGKKKKFYLSPAIKIMVKYQK